MADHGVKDGAEGNAGVPLDAAEVPLQGIDQHPRADKHKDGKQDLVKRRTPFDGGEDHGGDEQSRQITENHQKGNDAHTDP